MDYANNKNVLITGLLILLLISFIVNAFIIFRLSKIDAHIDKMAEIRISLPPELQKKIAANYEQALSESSQAAAIYEQALKKQADQLAELQKRIDRDYAQASKDQSVKLAELQQKIISNHESALKDTTIQLAELSKQKIAGNEVAADKAFQLAQQCVRNGDLIAAKIYCLNAINHAPDKKQYFEELMKIQEKFPTETTVDDLEQISRILELGLYQVNAEEVSSVRRMLESVSQVIGKLRTESAEMEKRQIEENTRQLFASVKTGTLSQEHIDGLKEEARLQALQERVIALNELRANSDAVPDLNPGWCDDEIRRTGLLLEFTAAANAMTTHLNTAEQLLSGENPEKQLPAINSLVQTANGILSQSWGLDLAMLPGECSATLMETARRIERIEIKFNQVKSAPAFAKIQTLDGQIRRITTGKYTYRIQAIQNHIREITVLMQEVYDPDNRKTIEKNLEDYSRILSDYNAARYRSYQAWAVGKCNEAFQLYSSWKRVDEKDAIQVIDTYLTTIDSSLLAPETMKLYQDVLSKQFAEMNWKQIAKYEANLATSVKFTLEDF